jgi:transposase
MYKKIEAGIKVKVAIEALKGEKTLAQIGSEYGVHPNQIGRWKQELLEGAAGIFGRGHSKNNSDSQEKADKLHRIIGELKVENDWLKKKLDQLG